MINVCRISDLKKREAPEAKKLLRRSQIFVHADSTAWAAYCQAKIPELSAVDAEGTEPTDILLRAIGPTLRALGVSGALLDPVLELHGSDGSLIAENDNWRDDQQEQILATTIPPSDDQESAILATLPPGNYTALVRGAGTSSGIALVEVYNLTGN